MIKSHLNKLPLCLLGVFTGEGLALANDDFQFKGFGTVGYTQAVKVETKDGQEPTVFNGITKRGDFARDTRYGLNFSKKLTDTTRAVYQLGGSTSNSIYGKVNNPELKPKTQLMMLQYMPTDAILVRLGMQPSPFWLISEEREISYTLPWLRPPMEVYGIGETEYLNGLSLSYTFDLDVASLRLTASHGEVNLWDIPRTPTIDNSIENFYTSFFIAELEYSELVFRGVYAFTNNDSVLYYNEDTTTQINGVDYKTRTQQQVGTKIDFAAFGVRGNIGDVSLISEYVVRRMYFKEGVGSRASLVSDSLHRSSGGYVTLGYQLGDFLPRLTLAQNVTRMTNQDKVETAQSAGVVEPLKSAIEKLAATEVKKAIGGEQMTWQLGLNYYASSNIQLKFELEQTATGDTYPGLNGLPKDTTFTTVSFGSDFVF